MDLVAYFDNMGYKTMDLREKGGAIWVVGSQKQLRDIMAKLKKEHNVCFQFCEDSKAIKKHFGGSGGGWWTKNSVDSFNPANCRPPELERKKGTSIPDEIQAIEVKTNNNPVTRQVPEPVNEKRINIPDEIAKEIDSFFG